MVFSCGLTASDTSAMKPPPETLMIDFIGQAAQQRLRSMQAACHTYPYTNAVFVRGFGSTHAASFFGSLWNTSKARRDMDGRPPIGEFSFYAERWLTFGFWIDL
jgi:hypothetical protein